MTSDDQRDPDVFARPDDSADRTARSSPGLWWGVAAFLAVVAVLALVAVVVEVTSIRPRSQADAAEEQAQSQVVRAAERFTVQVNTYDSGSINTYSKAMNTMMSPKFKADYKKVIDQLSSTIKQAKVTSKGEVLSSAVASLDTDSAQVLVVSDASVKTVFDPNVARHFRWEVSLVKIGGTWLVNDFSPVA